MLSLMSPTLSICVPPLMLLLHLWLTSLFLDAPPAPLPISRSTLPPFVSSSQSSPMVPDYMVKPPVT
jgi:hypothetical protein